MICISEVKIRSVTKDEKVFISSTMNFDELVTVNSSSDEEVEVIEEFSRTTTSSWISSDKEQINQFLGKVENSHKLPPRRKIKSVKMMNSLGPVRVDQVDLKHQQIRQVTATVLSRPGSARDDGLGQNKTKEFAR